MAIDLPVAGEEDVRSASVETLHSLDVVSNLGQIEAIVLEGREAVGLHEELLPLRIALPPGKSVELLGDQVGRRDEIPRGVDAGTGRPVGIVPLELALVA